MNNDKLYQNFYKKWEEVTALPPQTVGPFTPLYKRTIPLFKIAPWRVLIPIAVFLTVAGALLHDATAVQVASLLQRGF